jgi:hypothetical protein
MSVIIRRVWIECLDLLRPYITCYYISQTTIWHTTSSLLHNLRLPPEESPSQFSRLPKIFVNSLKAALIENTFPTILLLCVYRSVA